MNKFTSILSLIAVLTLLSVGYGIGHHFGAKTVKAPVVKASNKTYPPIIDGTIPDIHFTFKPLPKIVLVKDTVKIPVKMKDTGFFITNYNPIHLSAHKAIFTYFDPKTGSFGRNIYKIPEPKIRYDIFSTIQKSLVTHHTYLGAFGFVDFHRIGINGQVNADLNNIKQSNAMVGFNYKLAGN